MSSLVAQLTVSSVWVTCIFNLGLHVKSPLSSSSTLQASLKKKLLKGLKVQKTFSDGPRSSPKF